VSGFSDRPGGLARESIAERVDGIAAWINDLDARVRATELATSDEKTAKELRRAIEALAKHDPKLEKRLIERVDVLADRLATLASTVSTTAAALARKDGEIAALQKSVEEGGKRTEALARDLGRGTGTEEIEKLRAAVRAIQTERPARSSDSRIENLGAKVEYLNERIDTLATTVATTAAGLAGRDGELATLRQRLEDGSARVAQLGIEVRRSQGDGAVGQRVDAFQKTLDDMAATLADRESDVASVRARVDEAYARVGTVVAGIQGSVATLATQVGALEALPTTTEQALDAQSLALNARVDELARQLESLVTNLDSATSSLADGRAEIATLNERADEASARIESVVEELTQALSRLPEPGAVDPELERRLDALTGSVGEIAGQLTTLAASASADREQYAARTASLESELSLVGDRLLALEDVRDQVAARLDEAGASWAEERERVRSQLEALAGEGAGARQTSETFGAALEALTARVDTVDVERTAAAAELERISAALESERATLDTRLDELASALADATTSTGSGAESDRLLGDLTKRLDGLEQDGAAVAAEIGRLAAALDAERETLRAQLDTLSKAYSEAAAGGTTEHAERALAQIAARLDRLERDDTATTSEIARVTAAFEAEREALRAQLDGLSSALADATAASGGAVASAEALVGALTARVARVEEHGATVASEIARRAAEGAAELAAIESRLAQLATPSVNESKAEVASSEAFAALAERVAAMESEREALASEITQATGALHEEHAALVGRLDETLSRVADATSDAGSAPAATSEGEVAQLRVALDGLRMRLASSEQELATLVGTRDTTTRLDEVTRRLEALERSPVVVTAAGDANALPGDGRFRLELRALELRMEHAEAAARENREAVLVQLERLATRIEWRFRRLEEEFEARQPQAVGGQVVPLRPEV
jgi:chromosome segregation ATPase